MLKNVLLITKGPPLESTRKGGLFPVVIRQHLRIADHVTVFSVADRVGPSARKLENISPAEYINPALQGVSSIFSLSADGHLGWLVEADLVGYLRRTEVDAVLGLQSAPQTGLFAARIASRLQVPHASWEHLTTYERVTFVGRDRARLRNYFNNARGVAAVSSPVLDHICKNFQVELKNPAVIPNPVPDDFALNEKPDHNRFNSLKGSGKLFGAWTNWRHFKRLDLLLNSFDRVSKFLPNARLVIAGPADAVVMKECKNENVTFLGNISRAEIHALAHAVDVCCVPSDYETFGLPVIEALAAGTPVVSTDTDGPRDIMIHPFLGKLVPKGDARIFAEAMMAVATDIKSYPHAKIREYAIATYGEERQIRRWKNFYETLLQEVVESL